MSTDVFVLYEEDSLLIAEEMMQWKRIRHVPVVDRESNLQGLITHRDILRASISTIAELSSGERRAAQAGILLQEIMCTDILTVGPDANIKDAARVMLEEKIGCLLVVEDGQLVGILTEADFLKYVLDATGWPMEAISLN
ncbi:MAG: CBS domain-containing protein [Candidatus Tectomicrobia bacterium]|nr:CBS domain-containing protein [Candidatus Tectomicrobia bacterium]